MSEYGLSVFHDGKSLNLSHASPLTFIDMIEMKKRTRYWVRSGIFIRPTVHQSITQTVARPAVNCFAYVKDSFG
ncbi:hypothetical protein AAH678_16140 [Sodalis endosymbiont of Spalangia cameroni]|uniref:hypothetical protein n=1 Tax=Sodalis praecaptivus TaxID=1239307 RepID=UPI0031F7CBC9